VFDNHRIPPNACIKDHSSRLFDSVQIITVNSASFKSHAKPSHITKTYNCLRAQTLHHDDAGGMQVQCRTF